MNTGAAREILERYRPGMRVDAGDTELREALALTQSDQALGHWFARHCEFQEVIVRRVRAVPAAGHLKERLLRHHRQGLKRKPHPAMFWRQPAWLAAAAAVALCAASAGAYFAGSHRPDAFADYRARMVRTVLREYRMDIRTPEMTAVRRFMASNGAPDDYRVPEGLGRLQLAGGGFLRWRSRPVSMVCFHHPKGGMAYLFVLAHDGTKQPPPAQPEITTVNGRSCAAWSSGGHVYLLTGAEGVDVRTLL